ncbi:MAG: hypothetical protein A2X82_20055 [Geobacteraceae bacterium GWC2_55_20]|nr:MAG: hypothetical protein A2X82_20055 [Geobacteraceae bacterium GWC2_55_20]OGU24427.1 MAG: hypothetical protein A2X85_09295 [Geobacteraceae bacterium GWF2_54_21]HCE68412.1 hypothetical protein [Geobacter sp.]
MTAPRNYRNVHAAIAVNAATMFDDHPDAFEVLYYKADLSHPETVAPGLDVVGALDSSERTLEYDDPFPCKAIIVPEFKPFPMSDDGNRTDGVEPDPVVLLLSIIDVPEQSVIQWAEYVDDTNLRDVSMYVVRSEQVGVAPGVYAKLYCLPMQAFGDLL